MHQNESSDAESFDSDEELQLAFSEGRLQSGLNVETATPRTFINSIAGLKQKKAELQNSLKWIERLDLTNDPAPATAGTSDTINNDDDDDVHNDFKRELKFYRQAQATVLQGIKQLQQLNIPTKRPDDYFAQMAKSDDHMKLVRQKLLEKQMSTERSEKAKKLRELRKYGKKVQHEVLLKRQKEKREMLDAVKKYRKGHKDQLDFLENKGNKKKDQTEKSFQPNKKREYKNKKYGFGGQKKRSKMNTASSSADMSEFDARINSKGKSFKGGKKKGKKPKNARPGKSRRIKAKSKKK